MMSHEVKASIRNKIGVVVCKHGPDPMKMRTDEDGLCKGMDILTTCIECVMEDRINA